MTSWSHGIRCPLENCVCLYFSFGGMQAHIRKVHVVPPRIASVLTTLAVEITRHEIWMKVVKDIEEKQATLKKGNAQSQSEKAEGVKK